MNGNEVFVFEIKNKLRPADLEKFCGVQLPRFKRYFPQYEHHTLYGGVGALVVKDQLEARARNLGLYVLTQAGRMVSVRSGGYAPGASSKRSLRPAGGRTTPCSTNRPNRGRFSVGARTRDRRHQHRRR